MRNEDKNQITIVDIQMPFWSMVIFMVKAAIASIPAFIILFILGIVLGGFAKVMTIGNYFLPL